MLNTGAKQNETRNGHQVKEQGEGKPLDKWTGEKVTELCVVRGASLVTFASQTEGAIPECYGC